MWKPTVTCRPEARAFAISRSQSGRERPTGASIHTCLSASSAAIAAATCRRGGRHTATTSISRSARSAAAPRWRREIPYRASTDAEPLGIDVGHRHDLELPHFAHRGQMLLGPDLATSDEANPEWTLHSPTLGDAEFFWADYVR